MTKRILNLILNCIIVILIVAFLAGSLYRYWDYQARPDFYAVMSAPWYLSIQLSGIATAVVIVVCLVLKRIFRRR